MKRRAFFVGLAAVSLAFSAAAANRSDIFTVAVPVDATAANANVARDQARLDGERRAYAALMDRLTLAQDRGSLPTPGDAALSDLVLGFEVANEQHSSVRYLATYTYRFRADAIEQLLRGKGVPFAETLSKPLLVLPLLESAKGPVLWDDPNPWRDAWNKATLPPALVPMKMPLGEVDDVTAITAAAAEAGDNAGLQAIAKNYGNADVLATRATIHKGAGAESVDVASTRFVPAARGGEQSWVATYAGNAGESEPALLARAVAGTVAQVEDAWKQANMIDYGQSGTLTATVPAPDLASWVAVRNRLNATAAVQRTELVSLDRHQAVVVLHYVGRPGQLKTALAQNDLNLGGSDPDWVLTTFGAAAPPAPAAGASVLPAPAAGASAPKPPDAGGAPPPTAPAAAAAPSPPAGPAP